MRLAIRRVRSIRIFRTRRRSFWNWSGATRPKSVNGLKRPGLSAKWSGVTSALAGIEKWATADNADPGFSVLAIELQLQALRSPTFAEAYNALSRAHRQELGKQLIAKLFGLLGKQVPGDPVEIATGNSWPLSRGMALLSKEGEANRSGRIVVTFLKALIGSAPSAG